jgi:hypothetical protein
MAGTFSVTNVMISRLAMGGREGVRNGGITRGRGERDHEQMISKIKR